MDVDFRFVGKIKVEHVGNVFHVDTTTGDIGGHQHKHITFFERGKSLCSSGLALVAMNGIGWDADLAELLRQAVCSMLRAGKYNAAGHHLSLDEVNEQLALLTFLDEGDVLFNPVGGWRFWANVNFYRTVKHSTGQRTNGFRHGRTEHEVLTLVWNKGENALNVLAETHIKHAVSLVQNEVLHLAQIDMALIVKVQEAAWCRHQNVHTASKGFDLWRLPHASEYDGGIQRKMATVNAQAFSNLGGQFPSGGEHERSNGPSMVGLFSGEVVENGKGEGCRFSRSSLGDTHDVATRHEGWNCFGLNRRGGLIAFGSQGFQNSFIKF
jgi:hypothetical protein